MKLSCLCGRFLYLIVELEVSKISNGRTSTLILNLWMDPFFCCGLGTEVVMVTLKMVVHVHVWEKANVMNG